MGGRVCLEEGDRKLRQATEGAAAAARRALAEAVAERDSGIAERQRAQTESLETIVRAFMEDPGLSIRSAAERFHSATRPWWN